MKLIDKSALVAEIEDKINKYTKRGEESDAKRDGYGMYWGGVISCLNEIRSFLNTLEVKEVIAEQECTCNEALNRIIGGSWNLLCPVNKLGLKNGDKVKVIIKAQK